MPGDKIFALFAPYGLLVLIPINMREAPGDKGDFQQHASNINTFNRLSMSNIQHYDARMWYHAFGVYLLSGLAMYFLLIEYRQVGMRESIRKNAYRGRLGEGGKFVDVESFVGLNSCELFSSKIHFSSASW